MKNMIKSDKLEIISRMISKLNLLKSQLNAPHNPAELTAWEIKTIADLYDDFGKYEQITDQLLFERIRNNFPNNKVIQRNIESLLMQ